MSRRSDPDWGERRSERPKQLAGSPHNAEHAAVNYNLVGDPIRPESTMPTPTVRSTASRRPTIGGEIRRVGGVTKLLVFLALAATVTGAVMWFRDASAPPPHQPASSSIDPSLVSGLDGSGAASRAVGPKEGTSNTSLRTAPALTRIGVIFLIAFAAGFLLRSFLRIAIPFIALVALGAFVLQWSGVMPVDWGGVNEHAEEAGTWVASQSKSASNYFKSALPSAGAAVVGLFMGMRRR